jgi:hypothetical protein
MADVLKQRAKELPLLSSRNTWMRPPPHFSVSGAAVIAPL